MKPLYLLLLSAISISASAQLLPPAIEWKKTFGGTKAESAASVIPTSDHGYLVVGYSFSNDGQVTGHHGTTATSDAWVVKLDAAGNLVWQHSYGGTANDQFKHVIEAGNGDFICVGNTLSNDGDVTGLHGSAEDVWAVRISSTGSIIWSKVYGGTEKENGQVIRQAVDGGYLIGADTRSSDGDVTGHHGQSDIWVIKIDEQGNKQWQKAYGNAGAEFIMSMQVLSDNNYVIGGYRLYEGVPTFTLPVYSEYEEASLKIDAQGTAVWENYRGFQAGNPGQSRFCHTILETPDHQLFSMGHYFAASMSTVPLPYFKRINPATGNVMMTEGLYPYNFSDQYPRYKELGPDVATILPDSSLLACFSIKPGSEKNAGVFRVSIRDSLSTNIFYYSSLEGTGESYFSGLKVLPDESYIAAGSTNVTFGDLVAANGGYDFAVVKFSQSNIIKGKVFIDQNNNGIKDAGETYATNVEIESKKNNTTYGSVTDENGEFLHFTDTGTFVTTAKPNYPYYSVNPASKQTVFANYNSKDSFHFAFVPIPNKNDLRLTLQLLTPVRPGFANTYMLRFTNLGTTTIANTAIKMVKPSVFTYDSASATPASVVADTITWNIGAFAPLADSAIYVYMTAGVPPVVNIGDLLYASAVINPVTGDETPVNNGDTTGTVVTGSFDPNDKLENHGGFISPGAASLAKPLTYTIRFQNTGTDTAFNIIIRDTLDADLDWATLEIIGSSHNNNLQIKNGNILTWTFTNILLPDSNVNEPASHGYITYRIKPDATLQLGDMISNSASIYFDFNLPIRTNVHVTEVKADPPPTPVITGLQASYCDLVGVQTAKITNLPASGSGITVSVKIDGVTVPVGADSSFSFNVSTLASGAHTVTVQFSNSTANRISSPGFTIADAVDPNVDILASITTINNLATPVIITAVNEKGGGSAPLYTFARDRNFATPAQAESVNNTWTFDPAILAIGENKIYVRMKSNATCVVTNTVTDSVLLTRSSITGITDPDMPGQVINIYPNPFRDAITITGLSTSKTYTVRLFNLEGKQLVSKRVSGRSSIALTRQHQSSGIYWLSIYDENRKQLLGTVKMLKQ